MAKQYMVLYGRFRNGKVTEAESAEWAARQGLKDEYITTDDLPYPVSVYELPEPVQFKLNRTFDVTPI
jgi:hypothetical protein